VQGDRATVDGAVLRLPAAGVTAPRRSALSIRPHAIGLRAGGDQAAGEVNVLPGVVRRHIYLGDSRDYLIAVDGSAVALRVIVPPTIRHAVGDRVLLHIPLSACHLLAGV
jgi:hypothetical protein